MFKFEELVLEQLILELRFENGYLYLDNCGKTFREIIKRYTGIKEETVNVNEAKLVLPEDEIFLKFSPTNFNLSQNYPSNLNTVCEFGDFSYEIVMKNFGIDAFTRVGNRFIYTLKVGSVEEATELLKKTGFFNVSEEKKSKIGATLKDPGVKFTIVRDDGIGYIVNIAYFNRKYEVKLPKPVTAKYDMTKFSETGLTIDIDYHTLKPVDRGALVVSDLLKKNKKNIEFIIKELFN